MSIDGTFWIWFALLLFWRGTVLVYAIENVNNNVSIESLVVRPHPCLHSLDLKNLFNGQILNCFAEGKMHYLKVRTGTGDHDVATLECLSLLHLAAYVDRSNTDLLNVNVAFPSVHYYDGPANALSTSLCITEFFDEKMTLASFVSNCVKSTSDLYHSLQGLFDILFLLKSAGIAHNDINPHNVLVLKRDLSNANVVHSFAYTFLIVDFSYSLFPKYTSDIVDNFQQLLQASKINFAPPSGPLSDVFSLGVITEAILHRFSHDATSWANEIVELMLFTPSNITSAWGPENISVLKQRLQQIYDSLSPGRLDRLNIFPNKIEQFGISYNESDSDALKYSVSDDGNLIYAQLGESFEFAFFADMNLDGPVFLPVGESQMAWSVVVATMEELLRNGDKLGVSVIDISGGHSFMCAMTALVYNVNCTVLNIDANYEHDVRTALQLLPKSPTHEKLQYRTIAEDPASAFQADVVTVFGISLWLHYCVEGSLVHVVRKLALRAKEAILIEWVDPSDETIVKFNKRHPVCASSLNSSSPYTYSEFQKSLSVDFCGLSSYILGRPSNTRKISLSMHVTKMDLLDLQSDLRHCHFMMFGNTTENDFLKYKRLKEFHRSLVVVADSNKN